MILALDVYYSKDSANCVGVLFNWEDTFPAKIYRTTIACFENYIPGCFYQREMPSILALLDKVEFTDLEAIVVDGHVFTDTTNFGLGGMVWLKIGQQVPIIGIAKNSFFNNSDTVVEVYRGKSKKPLYVSCVGTEIESVITNIKRMNGEFRIPTILKQLDRLSRQ